MSLTRQTQKVFGSNADANQIAAFGTMKTGTPVYSTNLSTLQTQEYTKGWSEAILDDKAPYLEEMNAVQYGLSYQIAYLLQEGIGAYDANTNYSDTSIVKVFEDGKLYFYHSLIDNNIGHALSDDTYWEKINISDTRNIGEIVTSTIPLTDAGLHLLDGSLLSGSGSYSDFVDYIAGLYTAAPSANYFCSEADWQTSVTNYGVCGKFVYDSVNNTVRLPKITGFTEGAAGVSTLGNLTAAGLPNITGRVGAVAYGSGDISGCFGNYTRANGEINNTNADPDWRADFNASWSNAIYGNSSTVQPQSIKVLYYIVIANTTKTQIIVDIDNIATDLAGKVDLDGTNAIFPHITTTYVNGDSWYRVYSDGWCEQGSVFTNTSNKQSVTLLQNYINTNYNVQLTILNSAEGSSTSNVKVNSKSTSSFEAWVESAERPIMWRACGYIS